MTAIPPKSASRIRPRAPSRPGGTAPHRVSLFAVLILALAVLSSLQLAPSVLAGPPSPEVREADLLIRVVRTGPAEASVLGVALSLNDTVELLVDGVPVATAIPVWNLDYWFLHVPVSDRSIVQARIGPLDSPSVPVPPYVPDRVGPPGFVYTQGTRLLINGTPVRFFGVNEPTAFPYALIASGLFGWENASRYWGLNQLFPSGPEARIENVSTPDELWREYFRYLLHYQGNAAEPSHPAPNLLRIWIVADNFDLEKTYYAWRDRPAEFWRVLDSLVYWADRAGVYLVPVLGHIHQGPGNSMYDPTSAMYARHLQLVRSIVARYDDHPRIAMWDLWNEADANNDAYWATVGGIDGYRAWAARYLVDVRPYSKNHLLTLGTGGWTLFPGSPAFGWQYHFFWNDIPGLEVSSHHAYGTAESQYLIDWTTAWHEALGVPHYEGEFGYNEYPGPSGHGMGYWPWFTNRTRTEGWPAVSAMVLNDNGRGAYSDYPYTGPLPDYPAGSPPVSDLPPVAAFTVMPRVPVMRSRVVFDASISSDDVGIVRYEWRFGDRGFAEGEVAHYVFPAPGAYLVTLTVTDTSGQRDAWTITVLVAPLIFPLGPFSIPWQPPWAAVALFLGLAVPASIQRVLPAVPRGVGKRASKVPIPGRGGR